MDEKEHFYFLEMNTRIQVEHPVTEEITGIDIVEQQIHIANGQKLSISQDDLEINGHAIEARIYAEDPKTFFPSPGYISTFDIPMGENIRIESAATSNYQVTPFYDPMISKLIVKGANRKEAIELLIDTLAKTTIEGIKTNVPILLDIARHDAFQSGKTTTKFIETYFSPVKRN